MTVDVTNPSRKCFAVIVSWLLHRAARSNVRVIYYNLTLLSIGGVIAFNKELDDANVTAFKISSDSLDSNTNYVVILEARLLLHDESQYSLQSNFSIKTPSCTGRLLFKPLIEFLGRGSVLCGKGVKELGGHIGRYCFY